MRPQGMRDHSARSRPRGWLGLAAATTALGGVGLATLGLVAPIVGFVAFALGASVCLIAGVVSLVRLLRGRGLSIGGAAAMAVGAAFLLLVVRSAGAPRINDFTTDLDDPPRFDAAAALPAHANADLAYPRAFAAVQQGCCADLHPARLPVPPAEAFARAHALAETSPAWRVIGADPAAGTIEAEVTSSLFRFRDDVAIRVRPADGGSRVDVRSRSRVGRGDLGANAARIRAFVASLEHGDPAPARP